MNRLRRFALRYLVADAVPLSPRERWLSAAAGLFGLLLMQGVLAVLPVPPGVAYLLPPLGASTVILFALPHSPLAQPWSLAGGLLLSAGVGWLCGSWLQPSWLAASLAVGIAIWLMARLRCLHPPGGAMAVVFALAAPRHSLSLTTAVLNAVAALVAVVVVNNLLPGRHYPQCAPTRPKQPPRPVRHAIRHDDLRHALTTLDAYLDVSEDDLVRVYDLATMHAHHRHERRTCGEIMSFPAIAVEFGTPLAEAWMLLRENGLAGLPVVDRARRVIGVLSPDDFLSHVRPGREGIGDNLRRLLRPTPGMHADKPETVGQIMSERFARATVDTPIGDVAALLAGAGYPAVVPVVDGERRLAGVLTTGDLLAAVYHRQAAAAARG